LAFGKAVDEKGQGLYYFGNQIIKMDFQNISLTFNKTLSKNYKCKNKRKLISKIYYFFLWDTFLIHFPYKTRIIDQ
jgi:hypothetical protein